MVERQDRHALGVDVAAKQAILNHRQHMGDDCRLMAVLGDILLAEVVHQRPALDERHAHNPRQESAFLSRG